MKKKIISFQYKTTRVKPIKIIGAITTAQVLVENREYDKISMKKKVIEILDLCMLHAARPKRKYKKKEEDLEPDNDQHWINPVFKINQLISKFSSRFAATIVNIEVNLTDNTTLDFDKILGLDVWLWSGKK